MTTPKLLVLDLDGTTLTADRTLAEQDVLAARRLARAGVKVTIATGRIFPGTKWVAEALGVEGPVAVMNGCELLDARSGERVFGAYVHPGAHGAIRRVLYEHGLSPFLFESRTIHYGGDDDHHAPYLGVWSEQLSRHLDVWDGAPWGSSQEVVAVSAAGPAERVDEALRALDEVLGEDLHTVRFQTFTGHGFLELRRREDKGTAIERLAAWHGCTVEDVVAVGDWVNDLPMLERAGRSFAVAHAHPRAVEAADELLEESRDGGAVAQVAARVWGV